MSTKIIDMSKQIFKQKSCVLNSVKNKIYRVGRKIIFGSDNWT